MPRKRNAFAKEQVPEEQALREQAPFVEPDRAAVDSNDQEVSAEQAEQPLSLLDYMANGVREDVRGFMESFGITGHAPGSVFASMMAITDSIHMELSPTSHANEQEQIPAPDQQSAEPTEAPIPLNVRINSLEMDGDTRAFATAEYGDMIVRRLRVKEDGYGALSVSMPKYRLPGGWEETCRFNTIDARNRLSTAVLDAYQQKLAQLQVPEQTVPEPAPEQGDAPEEEPALDEQDNSGMSMTQW